MEEDALTDFECWWKDVFKGNSRDWCDFKDKEVMRSAFNAGRISTTTSGRAYEQNCALCGTPMFDSQSFMPGEVHGTCAVARASGYHQGRAEAERNSDDNDKFKTTLTEGLKGGLLVTDHIEGDLAMVAATTPAPDGWTRG